MIMDKKDSYEKLSKPGLWFVKTRQPCIELCKYVYDLAVELGLHVRVFSSASKAEIQNNVFEMIKNKYINMASDELERNWLEQEMTEYYTHGQLWYPEEMNDYVPNGSFWSNYVSFDEFKELSYIFNYSRNLVLIDNLSEVRYDGDSDLFQSLPLIEREALEFKKTLIVFVSSNDSCTNKSFIKSRLL